ncbi:glycosyltransferase family 2 protein [Streptomyces sp. NBC_01476]|uniref:glycosyltransferase family 2 protein n=1 Tax=Streptomyces sp. NBC_01476 TaxID=2903881 RepID=UPI002E30B223|nr:glycosyltransferase family 2 protein [Streptomyces sp. NBC_01476]
MHSDEAGRRRYLAYALILAAALTAYAHHHIAQTIHQPSRLVAIDTLGFCWLAFSLIAAHTHIDVRPSRRQTRQLDERRVTVIVPLKNEDPTTFRALLDSLAAQSRLPQRLHIIDNGSTNTDCQRAFHQWAATSPAGMQVEYTVTGSIGKRAAQVLAFDADPTADIFVTLDSDTVLDPNAIAEGIAPFSRTDVTSVAGLLLCLNQSKNLLTRLVDLSFVMSFLNGRAAWSRLGSVVVNCGGLAFYRADVVRKYQDQYVTQTVWGRRVASGDDRMLTCYALLEGRTVIQERAIGYTLLPERMSHLVRQRIRWWRSFFWGGTWLIKTFPITKPAWGMVLWQFASFALYTFVLPLVLIVHPVETRGLAVPFLIYMAGLSYVRSVRYLVVRRPDQSYASQLGSFALAPLSSLLNVFLCSILQYAGLLTFLKTGWSTRATVEVGITGQPDLAPATVIGVQGTDPDAPTTPIPVITGATAPLAKLYDPITEITLETHLPRHART